MAFDFDLACALRLRIEEDEREKRRLEAMTGHALTNELKGGPAKFDRSNAVQW